MARIKGAMVAGNAFAPSIVDHHGVFDRRVVEQPSEESGRIPISVISFPIPVGPNYFWFVGVDLFTICSTQES